MRLMEMTSDERVEFKSEGRCLLVDEGRIALLIGASKFLGSINAILQCYPVLFASKYKIHVAI